VSATAEYISTVEGGGQLDAERRILSRQDALEEALFTRLRLNVGIDLELIRSQYGTDVWREFGEELLPCVEAGLLIYDGGSLRLTRAGMLLAHEVMTVFIRSTVR
jgi:coproporphyrinogen III oxidase-like Fe-S oxidoreductase